MAAEYSRSRKWNRRRGPHLAAKQRFEEAQYAAGGVSLRSGLLFSRPAQGDAWSTGRRSGNAKPDEVASTGVMVMLVSKQRSGASISQLVA
ncbi:MAG TPA: hypothetical protein VJ625_01070 [Propionibacteriaceae bacterium]|nr:hypothetical protein [Propionibacteriaceae bacterium]